VHKPKVPDNKLEVKLRQEYPAILRWMIEGCLDWQAHGLVRPEIVTATTSEYFEEQDCFGQWIHEKCECGPGKKESVAKLYESFKGLALTSGEDPKSMTAFGSMLSQRGFEKKKSSAIFYTGIALKPLPTISFQSTV
jgi:putative DNA primase/helicase